MCAVNLLLVWTGLSWTLSQAMQWRYTE